MKGALKGLAALFGLSVVRQETMDELLASMDQLLETASNYNRAIAKHPRLELSLHMLANLPDQFADVYFEYLGASKAQLLQDLFVLAQLNGKRNGYFVEFGAADGIDLSNTYLLEKEFAWKGVLAEPARAWHDALTRNRHCRIDFRCVWRESNVELLFHQAPEAELSTIDTYTGLDQHAHRRQWAGNDKYSVNTVSLSDLLAEHDAPTVIDYMSIDTEGSEFDILAAFDFSKYNVRVITCEHNYTDARHRIHELLTAQGFERKFVELSQFDDWYTNTRPL